MLIGNNDEACVMRNEKSLVLTLNDVFSITRVSQYNFLVGFISI